MKARSSRVSVTWNASIASLAPITREPKEKQKQVNELEVHIMTAVAASGAALVIAAFPPFAAQTPQEHQHAAPATAKPRAGMDAKCQAIMAEKQTMMADMKAADLRIDGLVVTMNAASGMAKADATTAVVSEMVAQQRTMRDSKMKMDQDMMAHMMEHMQAGTASMAAYPMMKQMGGMKQ